jgi:glutathione S-transferase
VTGDRSADLAQQRQGGGGAARAVHADDVGAGVLQPPARVRRRPSLAHEALSRDRQRDHRRLARALDRLERQERLAAERIRLADDEVDAGVDRPADLLVEDAPRLLV